MKDGQGQPLVSIIVITYNSAKFVLETLKSTKAQTYKNIELIVSDDCSTDDTVKLCAKWLENNKDRFFRITLITSPKNTGIAPNCNRGLKAAEGEWAKFIAGDDILLDTCLHDNIDFISSSDSNIRILCSDMQMIYQKSNYQSIGEMYQIDTAFFHESISSHRQHQMLLKGDRVPTPTTMIQKSLLLELNGFDERFPMMEDYPFWLKATKNGVVIKYMPKTTVLYRVHAASVFTSTLIDHKHIVNEHYYKNVRPFEKFYIFPFLNITERLKRQLNFFRMGLIIFIGNDKKSLVTNLINDFLIFINRCINKVFSNYLVLL